MIKFSVNLASVDDLHGHLLSCDAYYVPPLSERVALLSYADKLRKKSVTFEAWSDATLIGLVACYMNTSLPAFISDVSVREEFWGRGVSETLLMNCFGEARDEGATAIKLEVGVGSEKAKALYTKLGFRKISDGDQVILMTKDLKS